VADKDDVDSTPESGDPAADPSDRSAAPSGAGGSHALEPVEPAVAGVPADADEPTFRDRERMVAEGDDEDPERDHEAELEDGDRELVTVGASSKEVSESGAGTRDRSRAKKDKATPRQKQVVEKERRTGPVKFLRESVSELQKVVYPTGNQLVNYFIVVLIFVLFIIAIVSVLDLAFGKAIIAVFG
jgi:preprotein translocase subunit SecE